MSGDCCDMRIIIELERENLRFIAQTGYFYYAVIPTGRVYFRTLALYFGEVIGASTSPFTRKFSSPRNIYHPTT